MEEKPNKQVSSSQQQQQSIKGASGYGLYLNPHQFEAVQALSGENQSDLVGEEDVEEKERNPKHQNTKGHGEQITSKPKRPQKEIDDLSPMKLNILRKKSEQLQQQRDLDAEYQQALKHQDEILGIKLVPTQQKKSVSLMVPTSTTQKAPKKIAQPSRESNPNSHYSKQIEEEERKNQELQERELQKMEQQLNQTSTARLADYFVTIGVDDYHTEEEVTGMPSIRNPQSIIPDQEEGQGLDIKQQEEAKNLHIQQQLKNKVQLDVIDPDDDFSKVVSKLEIFVIKDQDMFKLEQIIGGVPIKVKHPEEINNPLEKWIDLRGDKYIYLKITYEDIAKCKRPITDLNFYKISRFKQQPNKMCIHVKQNIEPIPVKEYGDTDADSKFKKTKQLGKESKGGTNKQDDMYNFYGDYDLTSFFEDTSGLDPALQKKNLCLCVSIKRQAPIMDVILVIGQQVDASGQILLNPVTDTEIQQRENLTINWDVPDGYKKLAYSVGSYGFLNRLLCLKNRDVMKRQLKARVMDRYPKVDRPYYPFPHSISDFCFPSGIMLKTEEGSPEFFHFSLTDQEGSMIYGTCLIFDETLSDAFRQKLKSMYVKNSSSVRSLKAICILSHYSFNTPFKQILMQLYRMQISSTKLSIPIERHITNIVEEIPLPDEGKLLVQHEIGGRTASFYRPTDQNPPVVDREEIEILFRCLQVEGIIEIYTALLLERKVLMVSKHKALLTQVINCFLSFMFPFQWKHPLIPILPLSMIETLDAPFPYFIGIEPTPLLEELDIEGDVIRVELDTGIIMVPNDQLTGSHIPSMPFRECKALKTRLHNASKHLIEQTDIPDPAMLEQVDLAFNHACVYDPEEEHLFDHLEIRDAFLEFTSSIMVGYTKYLKDPSEQPEQITCSRDCFDLDKFRLQKDAKKSYSFIYRLTETTHFSYFIECRALGRTERDAQILHFEKLISEKRTRMRPRLILPFHEEKSVKTMTPNEEGIGPEDGWCYKVFPLLSEKFLLPPRPIPDYNQDALQQQIMGCLIRNEELVKMHDNEWARYMLEVLYLLWFHVFCSTLPIYGAHAPNLIDFARRLLNHVRQRIKPMRDIEFIYRRLFDSCGTCKQMTQLCELNKEMVKNNIQPDKVTSGTYFQALLQCKRRGGAKEADEDKRKSYFAHRMEDYQARLNQPIHQDSEDNRSQNRMSNLSGQNLQKQNSFASHDQKSVFDRKNSIQGAENAFADDEQHLGVVDFGEVLERRETTQQTALDTQGVGRTSSITQKLSSVLENSLFMEIEKNCSKCKGFLREEELFTGFQKNLSNYTVKCPICGECFVPKFSIYSEQENTYVKGRKGQTLSLLPPVTLYKEFFNIITKEGDQVLMSESFISEHRLVFWNIILYSKILKLPVFMLDLDYSPYHQKVHCSQIKKFLPVDKNKSFFGQQRKSSATRLLPPKLDSSALKKLNEIDQSPNRLGIGKGGLNPQNIYQGTDPDFDRSSQNGGRKSSVKRMASSVIGLFSSGKKQSSSNVLDENVLSQMSNLDNSQNNIKDGIPVLNNLQPKMSIEKDDKKFSLRQQEPLSSSLIKKSGGVQGIHFNNQNNEVMSHAIENNNKGFQSTLNSLMTLKKPSSQKSGGKTSQKSGGAGSAITSLSDLEKIERIMNEAQHADKNIVKYFGKHFEEFRREMHYNREIVLSDMLLDHAIPEVQPQEQIQPRATEQQQDYAINNDYKDQQ